MNDENQPRDPISKLIPPSHLELLGRAAQVHKLGMTLVISDEIMHQLNRGQTGLCLLADGGVVIMITETMLRQAYSEVEVHP